MESWFTTKKILVIIGITLLLLIGTFINHKNGGLVQNLMPQIIEGFNLFSKGNLTGDTVYINDSKAYISATPSRITSPSYVNFEIQSKTYSGDIDVAFGFDTEIVRPKSAELYKPRDIYSNITERLVVYNVTDITTTNESCDYGNEYNNIKRLATHLNCVDHNGQCSEYEEVSEVYCFDNYVNEGDIYFLEWRTEVVEHKDWLDFSDSLDSIYYDYDGKNKWWYIKNVPIEANQTYTIRAYVDVPISLEGVSGKYDVAIKPSDETISEAISNEHFYFLDPWYNVSWYYAKNLTINSSLVTEELTDFPVLISITDDNLSEYAQEDGDDIVFTNSSGSKLSHEIEFYNSTDGQLIAWVKVPVVDNESDTIIQMYYNNSDADNQENVEDVWSNDFTGVYHLNDYNTTDVQNSVDLTEFGKKDAVGEPSQTTLALGKIGYAQDFVRKDEITITGKSGSPAPATVEAWSFYDSSDSAGAEIISISDSMALRGATGGTIFGFYHYASGWRTTTGDSTDRRGAWHYSTYVNYRPSASSQKVYVNGVEEGSTTYADNLNYLNYDTSIGANAAGGITQDYDGRIDEVRISNTTRSAGWINATYQSTNSPSSFIEVGEEEQGITDTEYPSFSNYWDNNGTLLDSGTGLFNVTLLSTNGTVYLNINGSQVIAKNETANVYNASYDFAEAGTYAYNWTSYGNGTEENYNISELRSYDVNYSYIYPEFSSDVEKPVNATEYVEDNIYWFNITILSTNGTSGIEFDGTNYTLSNITDNFNWTTLDLKAGTYSYYYWAYGNSTGITFNNSIDYDYTIAKNSSLVISQTFTSPITYPTETDFAGVGCPSQLTCSLNLTNGIFGVGTIYSNYSTAGNENYTATSNVSSITIEQNTSACDVYFNQSSPLEYPQTFGVFTNCSSAFQIYRNETAVNNASLQSLGVGANYNFTVFREDNANYSNIVSNATFTITQNTSYVLSVTGTSPITYGTAGDVAGTGCPSEIICNLSRNDTGLDVSNPDTTVLGAGFYNYTYNSSGNTNYSVYTDSFILEVQKAVPEGNITNNTELSLEYPNPFNFSIAEGNTGDGDVTYVVYRNGEDVTTEADQNIILGVGTWEYIYNTTGGENYSANISMSNFTVTITQNTSLVLGISGTSPITYPTETDVAGSDCPAELSCALDISNRIYGVGESPVTFNYSTDGNTNYSASSITTDITISQNTSAVLYTYLNHSRANITIENNTGIWLNTTLFNVSGTINLYNNETPINSGTDQIGNFTDYNMTGIYNITGIYEGNENYSGYNETWYVNVTVTADTTPPTFDNLQNHTHTVNTSFSFDLDATDLSGIDTFTLNETGNFTINGETGVITNSSELSKIKIYWLNVSVNDTAGNLNSGVFYINVTAVAPTGINYGYRIQNLTSSLISWWVSVGDSVMMYLHPHDNPSSCGSDEEGRMYMDSSLHEMCYCNGSNWRQFDSDETC